MIEETMAEFITIEAIPQSQQDSSQKVWDAVKTVFSEGESIGYWGYPLFIKVANQFQGPDILIADRYLGLIIVNVLAINIEQVISYNQGNLELQNFTYNPIEITQKYAQILRAKGDKLNKIRDKITARSLLIFPYINSEQWQAKRFLGLDDGSNLVFANQLGKVGLRERIERSQPIIVGNGFNNDEEWQSFLSLISGNYILKKSLPPLDQRDGKTKLNILATAQEQIYHWDVLQESIGKSIPLGAQRVRGIAGSGKTVLFCQKAALMHLKHPEWDIAFVFFTRSLYDQIIDLISQWIDCFTDGQIRYNPHTSRLKVLHAWGAKERDGFYRYVCREHNIKPGTVKNSQENDGPRRLASLCKQLLEKAEIKPLFDSILIDEGQDLVTDEDLKFEDKQAIYWLAYQSLKPVDPTLPEQRRLIWAFDEAQSLSSLVVPETKEILGENLSNLIGGESGGIYPGGIRKAYDMRCCYRTPGSILTIAYALGVGLLRQDGFIKQGRMRKTDFESIGFEVEGDFRTTNTPITITRPKSYSPNPIPELWGDSVFNFTTYNSRQEELTALVDKLNSTLSTDRLKPCRDILIIALGETSAPSFTANKLQTEIANFLLEHGVNIFIPSALQPNQVNPKYPQSNPDLFWDYTGRGITISTIDRAKGNEADLVYLVGLDNIAKNEHNFSLRNQLFVALTRSRGWVELSGVRGDYPFYTEIQQVINSGDRITFTIKSKAQSEEG
jgi:superfamily I DNA and RNA helicase